MIGLGVPNTIKSHRIWALKPYDLGSWTPRETSNLKTLLFGFLEPYRNPKPLNPVNRIIARSCAKEELRELFCIQLDSYNLMTLGCCYEIKLP